MNATTSHVEADALLLLLDDSDILRLGALLGLRARAAGCADAALVDAFIDSDDTPFRRSGQRLLLSALPHARPH